MANAEMTNGAFCVDRDVRAALITQSSLHTNQLSDGITYQVKDKVYELLPTNDVMIYLANGASLKMSSNSVFSIDLYDQEITNGTVPTIIRGGTYNISTTLNNGEIWLYNPINDENCSFILNTPNISYQFKHGLFYCKSTENASVLIVYDGYCELMDDNNKDQKIEKSQMVATLPIANAPKGLSGKVFNGVSNLKAIELKKISEPFISLTNMANDVKFYLIDGNLYGLPTK